MLIAPPKTLENTTDKENFVSSYLDVYNSSHFPPHIPSANFGELNESNLWNWFANMELPLNQPACSAFLETRLCSLWGFSFLGAESPPHLQQSAQSLQLSFISNSKTIVQHKAWSLSFLLDHFIIRKRSWRETGATAKLHLSSQTRTGPYRVPMG